MSPKSCIAINFFGGVAVSVNGDALNSFYTTRAQQLLCFLVLNRTQFYRREYLADLFWPDRSTDQGQASLRTELWRIRTTFAKANKNARQLFSETANGVRFAPKIACSIDFEDFDALLKSKSVYNRPENLWAAVSLYKGDLLSGLDDEWCLYHRELYRSQYLSALEKLIELAMAETHWGEAIELTIRFLIQDPFAEHIHLKLMKCYSAVGNRAAAIRQYELYRQRLDEAFRISPMPETTAAFEALRQEPAHKLPPHKLEPTTRRLSEDSTYIFNALVTMRRCIAQATSSFEASVSQIVRPRD